MSPTADAAPRARHALRTRGGGCAGSKLETPAAHAQEVTVEVAEARADAPSSAELLDQLRAFDEASSAARADVTLRVREEELKAVDEALGHLVSELRYDTARKSKDMTRRLNERAMLSPRANRARAVSVVFDS